MNIQIEDYFGNDVIKLNYCLKDKQMHEINAIGVGVLASKCGYDVADVETDENGIDFIRVQQVNVDNSEEQEKKDLMELINELNKAYL